MSFGASIGSWLRNYANFHGRAPRSAYFWVLLLNVIVTVLAAIANNASGNHFSMSPTGLVWPRYGPIYLIYVWAVLTPSIALSVCRLHDRNMSGWWFLLAFIPYAGAIILIVLSAFPGTTGGNRFGPGPLTGNPTEPLSSARP